MGGEAGRYALYFVPAQESALWRFGCRTIGYDAVSGMETAPVAPPGAGAIGWAEATDEPRRYGFHATLKAPFFLRNGLGEAELIDSLAEFTRRQAVIPGLGLEVAALGSFVALVLGAPNAAVQDFAFRVVDAFEPFRAPLSASDRERRLAAPLTPRQIVSLDQYGYPYVGTDFRFHMTLTGRLVPDRITEVRDALARAFAAAVTDPATAIDQIALFRQPERTGRFRLIARFPLAAA